MIDISKLPSIRDIHQCILLQCVRISFSQQSCQYVVRIKDFISMLSEKWYFMVAAICMYEEWGWASFHMLKSHSLFPFLCNVFVYSVHYSLVSRNSLHVKVVTNICLLTLWLFCHAEVLLKKIQYFPSCIISEVIVRNTLLTLILKG